MDVIFLLLLFKKGKHDKSIMAILDRHKYNSIYSLGLKSRMWEA